MKQRTMDEMISYFNQQVSEMDIKREDKIKLLGMITAIGYENKKLERKTGRWIETNPQNSEICRLINCSECGKGYIVNISVPYEDWTDAHKFCVECGAKMEREMKI